MDTKSVAKLCKDVANTIEAFDGNCGKFAIALAQFLGEENCEFIIAENSEIPEACFHVALKYKGKIFDGNGFTTIRAVKRYGIEDEGKPIIIKLPVIEDHIWYVSRYTDWDMESDEILELFKSLSA
jgi:hypothetical protein